MKIKFLTSVAGREFTIRRGEIIDMEPREAKRWLDNGDAEIVRGSVEAAMLETPETATAPAQRKKGRISL